jgi:hypothetical protein
MTVLNIAIKKTNLPMLRARRAGVRLSVAYHPLHVWGHSEADDTSERGRSSGYQ